ncbi:hypothetical protein Zmor_011217 [Zophobas morio]|uniref:Uncharacterized protein n=1 Tax=Zophobas morio TaxID=2755281 RepID=A0AA38IKB4_9CUCU|nr:hypothetical protein Zmor_011217 [Zophobas morio]
MYKFIIFELTFSFNCTLTPIKSAPGTGDVSFGCLLDRNYEFCNYAPPPSLATNENFTTIEFAAGVGGA